MKTSITHHLAATTASLAFMVGAALGQDAELPPLGPDELVFSVDNMDPSVDPGADFQRYAAGAWIDRVERPSRLAAYGLAAVMQEHLKQQMKVAVARAGEEAASAPKGSAVQQVGDFYNAYMDTEARDAAGIEPIRSELDAIDAIESYDDLMRYLGHWAKTIDIPPLAAIGPNADLADSKRYALWAVGARLTLQDTLADTYNDAPDSERRQAYRTYIADSLTIVGYEAARAAEMAEMIDALEAELNAALLTPTEVVDPRNWYHPMPLADLQAQIPELDISLYLDETGYPVPERIVLYEPRLYPALSKLLRERPLQDFKDYLSYRAIENFREVLTTEFEEPGRAFREVMTGVAVLPPREERALTLMQQNLGQPLGQVYVDNFFSEETRKKALDMMLRMRDAFLARIPTRDWLSDETRKAALEKAEQLSYKAGYPDEWIDFSGVEIGPDSVANMKNLVEFAFARQRDKFDRPVENDPFNAKSTLPTVINASYNPQINGFEVPAAFLQAPVFESDADAPIYFCRLGATIGHEMTHGFDSGGRQYDADGNLRDWWTEEDAARFDEEAEKLVEQADAYEALPGLQLKGAQTVKENMADVGGINFAYDALMAYLADHPDENVEIDGFTPAQRCFIAWTQLWTEKATDQHIRNQVTTDFHPPNNYRATAALQHVDAFYESFGIEEGDPMWLPPEQRVDAW